MMLKFECAFRYALAPLGGQKDKSVNFLVAAVPEDRDQGRKERGAGACLQVTSHKTCDRERTFRVSGAAALALAIGLLQIPSAQAQQGSPNAQEAVEITLVRVNITTETRGDGETVVLDGTRIANYHPKIIEMFPSTGIVLDASRHVLIFLGYRWADIQGRNHRIEIIAGQGQ